VPRVDADIVVDGKLDDAAWTQAATVDIAFETSPGDNLPASVKTTGYIAYTEDALLLGFRAEDPDPAKIRAFLRDRDALYDDDFLGVMLDTFDDGRRSYEFFVNPLGVQADLIREEATGNEDDSWDGLWTSAARITEAGTKSRCASRSPRCASRTPTARVASPPASCASVRASSATSISATGSSAARAACNARSTSSTALPASSRAATSRSRRR
jgi:hypothetical protein